MLFSYHVDNSVSWIPESTEIVSLVIEASDNRSSSILQPTIILCDCRNNGSCMWDNYTESSDIDTDKFAVSYTRHVQVAIFSSKNFILPR